MRRQGGNNVRDMVLIAVLLALGIALLLIQNNRGKEGSFVVVMVQGKEEARYSLSIDGEYAINGGTNIIEVKDGKVRMTEALCPNHLCVKQGWIRYGAQSIVCLPNKVVVRIEGAENGLDFVQ